MDLSKDVLKEFKNKNDGGVHNGVKITADILTQGIWPDQKVHPLKMPREI